MTITTLGDAASAALTMLTREQRTEVNTLDGQISSTSATSLTLDDLDSIISPGELIAVDDEVMYVRRYDTATGQMTVYRGQLGSTAATHADGAVVLVAPRFTPFEALNEVIAEVSDIGDRLFAVSTATPSFTAGAELVDLDSAAHDQVYRIISMKVSTSMTRRPWADSKFRLLRDMPTGDYPSGFAVDMLGSQRIAGTARITYAHSLDTSSLARATTLAAIGIPDYAADVLTFGACYRLLGPRDATSSDRSAQGNSRRDEETLPLAAIRSADWFSQRRDIALSRAQARQLAEYGWTTP